MSGTASSPPSSPPPPPPPCQILFRTKSSVTLHTVPPPPTNEQPNSKGGCGITLAEGPSTLHSFAPDGSAVLIHLPSVGVVKRNLDQSSIGNTSNDGGASADPFLADSRPIQFLSYSTLGTYIVTWERPSKPTDGSAPPPNLKIWRSSDGQYLTGFHLKNVRREAWPPIKWTHDERWALHGVTNEIHVYAGNAFTNAINGDEVRYESKVRCTGLTSFSLPSRAVSNLPTSSPPSKYLLSTFIGETKGKPARISLLRYPDKLGTETPGSKPAPVSKSFYQAEECTVKWSPRGDAALALTHTTVDTSGESYYGSTNLYLLVGDDGKGKGEGEATNVPLPSAGSGGQGGGPVLDVSWMPNPTKPPSFAIISGRMPALTSLHHGTTADPLFLFGNAHRNTIVWSPHGRFLTLGGFGNLAGGMDFWDKNKLKKIPQFDSQTGLDTGLTGNTASCAVGYGWAPSSRYFMVSTTSPRMNVDNGVRLYDYRGVEVTDDAGLVGWDNDTFRPDKLLAAEFVPAKEGVYADRPQSPPPKRQEGGGEGPAAAAAAAATSAKAGAGPAAAAAKPSAGAYVPPAGRYVPPGARKSGGGGTSLADRMRAEREGSTTGATKVVKKSGVVGMSSSGGPKKNVPVGMAADDGTGAGGKSKNALRKERQRLAKQKREEEEKLAAEEEAKKKQAEEEAKKAAPVDPAKRAKKIRKQLKQIDELKEKDGGDLNDDQKAKLATETSLREELEALGL